MKREQKDKVMLHRVKQIGHQIGKKLMIRKVKNGMRYLRVNSISNRRKKRKFNDDRLVYKLRVKIRFYGNRFKTSNVERISMGIVMDQPQVPKYRV